MALGLNDLPKYASFPPPSDNTARYPMLTLDPGRPAPENTVFRSPFRVDEGQMASEGGVARGYASPAATQNAVAGATAARTSNEGGGSSAARGYADNVVSFPVPKRDSNTVKGPVDNAPNRGLPYPGGVDMTNARMSAPGLNLPTFNAPPPAVAAGAAGVGGVGLLPPEFHSQISDLLDQATPLLKSSGIVDRLRGRQLMRARDRLIGGATSIAQTRTAGINAETGQVNAGANVLGAQTQAYRATNEVPLALLGAATHKYGFDSAAATADMQDRTHRYVNDQNTSVLSRGQDLRALEALPGMQETDYGNQLLQKGDTEGYHRFKSAGKMDLRPQPDQVTDAPAAGGLMIRSPGGKTTFQSYKDLQAEGTAATSAALKKRLEDQRAAGAK